MYFVLGGKGFVGSAVCSMLSERGEPFISIGRDNYTQFVGTACDVFVNCNGNARRFWANQNPAADFEISVASTMRSLVDFIYGLYVYISSVDVYLDTTDPAHNIEDTEIQPEQLCPYGFHKWLSEMLVRRYASQWLILRLGGLVGPGIKKNPIYDALAGQPIQISPRSELGFIDTGNVAAALYRLVTKGYRNQVFNMCGTGTLRIGDLPTLLGRAVTFSRGAEERTELYRISNGRLCEVMHIPESRHAVANFIREVRMDSGTAELSLASDQSNIRL